MKYEATCSHCGPVEIEKPMKARMPRRHTCGGMLTRRFSVPAVHFAAPGFYSTDVARMQKQVGPERFAKFEKQKADADKRAKAGQLTGYEKALEGV